MRIERIGLEYRQFRARAESIVDTLSADPISPVMGASKPAMSRNNVDASDGPTTTAFAVVIGDTSSMTTWRQTAC
jgi:hypothetical protein